jgi:hypothetical protein
LQDEVSNAIAELAVEYGSLLDEWLRLQSSLRPRDVRRANRLTAKAHRCARRLSATAEGRGEVEKVLSHPEPSVRLWAAAEVFEWNPEAVRSAVEAIRDSAGGLPALNAEVLLNEYEAGNRPWDW